MSKYLIEVPHEGRKEACMIVGLEDKAAAKQILPSLYKMKAKITRLEQLSRSDLSETVMEHHA